MSLLDRPDFEPNLSLPRHRWYPYKEGFSASLVANFLLDRVQRRPGVVVDPFAGSGTTVVEAASWGWTAVGVEVNPFSCFLAKVKSEKEYRTADFLQAYRMSLSKVTKKALRLPTDSTLVERDGLDKWLFNSSVARRFEEIRNSIAERVQRDKYRNLLLLALVAATTRASNAKRDGKCWRYKTGWKLRRYDRQDVDALFAETVRMFAADIERLGRLSGDGRIVRDDSRAWLGRRPDLVGQVDAVLTSPPYLNSFDYTDIYRPECFLLGAASTSRDLRKVRLQTLRSHVQVDWPRPAASDMHSVSSVVALLSSQKLWDRRIPDMVNAYFIDLERVVVASRSLLRSGGVLGMVVASSAYAGIVIPVEKILADILARAQFRSVEISALRETAGNGHHQNLSGKALSEALVIGVAA